MLTDSVAAVGRHEVPLGSKSFVAVRLQQGVRPLPPEFASAVDRRDYRHLLPLADGSPELVEERVLRFQGRPKSELERDEVDVLG